MSPLPLWIATPLLIVIAVFMGAVGLLSPVRRDDDIGDADHG